MSHEALAAVALRRIARDETIKDYILRTRPLYDALLPAALRFIGGTTLDECVAVVKDITADGTAVPIDFMGESTRDAASARAATEEFQRVVAAIVAHRLRASVSLDLSHIGLAIDPALAFEHASGLATTAAAAGIEIMISMEGSERRAAILELYARLGARFDHVGITVQAALHCSGDDLRAVLERPGRIRLVKGAYEEPLSVARPWGKDTDDAYRALAETLLASGHRCSTATHDPRMLDDLHAFIERRGLDRDPIEFEMLRGVTPDRLALMRTRGYRTRVYLPYGREWYLYLCHRLAEWPPNIYQAIADAVAGPRRGRAG